MSGNEKGAQKASLARFDLLGVPFVRDWMNSWRDLVFANHAARREAKAAMFAELAAAARQGIPLERALTMSAQTVGEANTPPLRGLARGAETRNPGFTGAVSFLLLVCNTITLYPLLAFRMVAVERIARILATRLLRRIRAGASLSEAMRAQKQDYDAAEVNMARAGEEWGALPKALQSIADFQGVESSLTMQGAVALYPFMIFWVVAALVSFILIKIIPKFADIYSQLGAELPRFTIFFIDEAYVISHSWSVVAGPFLATVTFFVYRAMMNGHAASRWAALAPIVLIAVMVGEAAVIRPDNFAQDIFIFGFISMLSAIVTVAVAILLVAIVVGLLFLPSLLSWMESAVLYIERRLAPILRGLPLLGRSTRAALEARWLGALALGLEAGASPHDALRSAGQICGGALGRRADLAAEDVEKGISIGEACARRALPRKKSSGRLALLDRRADYLPALRAIADDAAQDAAETLNRTGRLAEVIALLVIGGIVLAATLAIYYPLFMIPKIIGE